MSSIRKPVGPQPPQVYWRRRLMVLLGLVAIIVVIVLIVVGGSRGDDTAQQQTETEQSAEPAADEPAEEEQPDDGTCNPNRVTIEAVTDKESYAAGELPQISMKLTNVGTAACILDVATNLQVFEVGSGDEPYWLSSDCQTDATEAAVNLDPNVPQSTTPIPWDRTRSTPCDTSTQQVPAGDATYYLQVRLGELESAKKAFRLL